jgi:hypothetical protein
MRVTRLVVAAASAAIGIGVMLHLRKRLRRSALESSVGAAPKHGVQQLGRKALLANRAIKEMNERARRRSRQSTKEGYLAFVSHMKAEAAMEARFLQIELESLHKDGARRTSRRSLFLMIALTPTLTLPQPDPNQMSSFSIRTTCVI